MLRTRLQSTLLAAVMLAATACSVQPLNVEVAFDTTGDLDVGAEVMLDGEEIGRVTGIDWKEGSEDPRLVQVRVEPAHRDRIKSDTRFQIEIEGFQEPRYFLGVTEGRGESVGNGHRFEGRVSLTARLTGAVWRSVDEVLRPEIERAADEFRRGLDEAARYGQEQWEVLRPELERRVAELALLAQAEGRELSENAREELDRLLDRYDELLDEYGEQRAEE